MSFLKPYKLLSSVTIAGWLKNVMSQAGIDTSVFKAHSTRVASASAASHAGASLREMDSAGWFRESTIGQFHYKLILGPLLENQSFNHIWRLLVKFGGFEHTLTCAKPCHDVEL